MAECRSNNRSPLLAGDRCWDPSSSSAPLPFEQEDHCFNGQENNLRVFLTLPPFTDLKDLDTFLMRLYRYWYDGGFVVSMMTHTLHIVALLFTFALSWLILLHINWSVILHQCSGPGVSCTWKDITRSDINVFRNSKTWWEALWFFHVWMFLIGFGMLLLGSACVAWRNCWETVAIRHFVRASLELPTDNAMQAVSWPEFLHLVLKACNGASASLTVSDVVGSLTRYDNFFIPLVQKNILTRHLPHWFPKRLVYTTVTLWITHLAIFTHLFDSSRRLNRSFLSDSSILRRRFQSFGILSLIFLAPSFMGAILLTLFKHAAEFRLDLTTSFHRRLNLYGYWVFLDYNELPHSFACRSQEINERIDKYLELQTVSHDIMRPLARLCQYILTSILGILIVVAMIDDGPLVHVQIGGHYLIYYSIVFGAALTILKYLGLDKTTVHPSGSLDGLSRYKQLTETATNVLESVHYVPQFWRHLVPSCFHSKVNSMSSLFLRLQHTRFQLELQTHYFSFRIQQLLEDTVGILLTPYLLLLVFPKASADICRFFTKTAYCHPFIGEVCIYSQFDEVLGLETLRNPGNKIEKSAIRFAIELWMVNAATRSSESQMDEQEASNFLSQAGISEDSQLAALLRRISNFQHQACTSSNKNSFSISPEFLNPLLTPDSTTGYIPMLHNFMFWYEKLLQNAAAASKSRLTPRDSSSDNREQF